MEQFLIEVKNVSKSFKGDAGIERCKYDLQRWKHIWDSRS